MAFTITKNKLQPKLLEKTAKARKRQSEKAAVTAAASIPNQNDLVPELELDWRKVSELTQSGRRVRKVSDGHVAQAIRSMQHFGFISPIIVRGPQVVDGNTRLRAAKELGLECVPCIDVSHLSASKARMLALNLNRLAETGEWDLGGLKLELSELKLEGYDLEWSGFTLQELDILLVDDEDEPESEAEDEPIAEPVTELGDLWLLDKHRLFCADALAEESYAVLMEGRLATTALTDPPFNVKIKNNVSGLGKHKHDNFLMATGEMSTAQFTDFLDTVHLRLQANLMAGGVAFVFIDWRSIDLVMNAGKKAGMTQVNTAVWHKGQGGGMGSFLRSAHELVVIFANGDKIKINNIELGRHGRMRTNVWEYPGANRPGTSAGKALKDHPTPKNVAMCVDALLDVSHEGDIVLDMFLGSGTTLIAADKAGRVCYGMELEPRFVDGIIRRWQKQTGKEAVHAETGLTFDETVAAKYEDEAQD